MRDMAGSVIIFVVIKIFVKDLCQNVMVSQFLVEKFTLLCDTASSSGDNGVGKYHSGSIMWEGVVTLSLIA